MSGLRGAWAPKQRGASDLTKPFLRNPLGAVHAAYRLQGDAPVMHIFKRVNIFLLDAEAPKYVLQEHADKLSAQEGNLDVAQHLFGTSFLYREDEIHKTARGALASLFARPEVLRRHAEVRQIAETQLARWRYAPIVDVFDEAKKFTLSVIGLYALGGIGSNHAEWVDELKTLASGLYAHKPSILPITRYGRARRARYLLNRRVLEVVADPARHHPFEGTSAWNALSELAERQQDPASYLLDQVITLLFAGYDTTSSVIAWLFDFALRDANIRTELVVECRDGTSDGQDASDTIRRPFLGKLIRETTRLKPPVYFIPRMALDNLKYKGEELHKGCLVNVMPLFTQRLKDELDGTNCFDPHRMPLSAYFAFGMGPKYCIGASLADLEIRTFVMTAFQLYDLELVSKDSLQSTYVPSLSPRRGPIVKVSQVERKRVVR